MISEKRKQNILGRMNKQYSFSTTDNNVRESTIKPDDFLKTTYEEKLRGGYPDTKNYREYARKVVLPSTVKTIKEILTGKKKTKYGIPIPFLAFDELGNPIGHEGRHTAVALKELGINRMPITIVRRKGLEKVI